MMKMLGSILDLHIHTKPQSSCSTIGLKDVLSNLHNRINGIALTNHDTLTKSIKFPIKNDFKEGEILIIPAVEITTTEGDILAFGINTLPSIRLSPDKAINIIHDEGGIAVAAHPYREGSQFEELENLEFDAIEINGKCGKRENKMARLTAQALNLPLIGGSDTHSLKDLNSCVTTFKKEIKSLEDLIYQIKQGLCYPTWIGTHRIK